MHILNKILIILILASCSGLEKTEKEKLREQNAKGEYVYRMKKERLYQIEDRPTPKEQEAYPWQKEKAITKS